MRKWIPGRDFLANLPLKWKLSLLVVPLLLLMELASITVITHHISTSYFDDFREDSDSIGNSISSELSSPLENEADTVQGIIDNVMKLEHDLAYVYVTNPAGKLIAHSFPHNFPDQLRNTSNGSPTADPNRTIVHLPNGAIHDLRVPLRNGTLGTLHVGMSATTLNESRDQFRNQLLAATFLITLVGIIVLLFMLRLLTKPLTDLAQATAKIGGGSQGAEPPSDGDEIRQLTRSIQLLTSGMLDNQSSRVTAEQGCREGETLYRSLLDNIDLGITMISKDFEVIIANAKQGRMFDRPPESFTGRKCYQEFEKRDAICPHCPGLKAMQSGKAEEIEATGIRDDGSTINVRIKAFPLRNERQEITGFVEIVTDISNQRNLEGELQRIKSIESIGLLAGGLAHDFNNLLTTIIGNIDLARIGADPEQDFVARLNAAEKACEQARRLTNQLLTFAKGGQPIKKKVHLPQILDEACHFTLSGSSLRYILDAPADLWPVEIDPGQMSQAIHNLLNNAKEALAANPTGKIFVVAENLELDATAQLPLPPGPYVKVAIVDEGRGIRPEILATIFNPYFTTKELGANKGTGLGLTICHSIIHQHGGHISVESKEGQGATFTIYLPALGTPTSRQQPPPGESGLPTSRPALHVLILEDEEAVAHITTSFLVSLHHHSEIASTGAEAIKLLQHAQAKGDPFDLLILDLTIRGGMGGEEVLHKLRAMAPAVPAIVTSGYTEDPIMATPLSYGFQAALAKPFNQATLRDAIATARTRPVLVPPPAQGTPPVQAV